MRYTKEQRQRIIEEFALRHGGIWFADKFYEEVEATGPDHEAYGWFTWDDNVAAREHRKWESRIFGRGLKVVFEIKTIRTGPRKLSYVEAPFVLSPLDQRNRGGGYLLTDEAQMEEFARQAHAALRSWLKRYESALLYAGGSPDAINRQINNLESVLVRDAVAAE